MFYFPTLTIAGSDCSGGAGIQADIKTMSALGCYAASVITSVTVQNTQGVYAVHSIPPDIVSRQIKAVMDDIHPLVVKIGMVNDAATIRAIADTLKSYQQNSSSSFKIILDPVMVSTSGCRLMQEDALDVFVKELIPMASLLTPNIPEAEILSGYSIQDTINYTLMAQAILSFGCNSVLIKGGHLMGNNKQDNLYMKDTSGELFVHSFPGVEIATSNTHGTGCTLSSAISSYLALGYDMIDSIAKAKDYVTNALLAGADVYIGEGHGAVNHLFKPITMNKRKYSANIKFQYITHYNEKYDYVSGAEQAMKGGCRWIQLRMKDASDEEILQVAETLEPICRRYHATFLLDDKVHLVGHTHADGVHLGKNDMPVDEARKILGKDKIIGGTANTFEDIERLYRQGADYIGCGPYRFTTTKKNLSPILGLEGYQSLCAKMKSENINIPIVAIGGILLDDVAQLMKTGITGIAISGAILNAEDPIETTKLFISSTND